MFIKNRKPEIRRLFRLMKPRILPYLTGILGQSMLGAGLNIVLAFTLKYMVDVPMKGQSELLVKAAFMIGGSLLLAIIVMPFLRYTYMKSIKLVMADFRKKVFEHMQKLPMRYFERHHSGDTVSRLTNDLQAIETIYSEQLAQLVTTLLLGIGSIVFMMLIEWKISLLFILIGMSILGINAVLAIPIRRLSDLIQKHMGLLTERVTDLLSGFYIMKMFQIEDIVTGVVERENIEVTKLGVKRAQKNAVLESTNYLLVMANFAGIISLGAILVFNNMAEFGDLTAIIQLQINVTQAFIAIGSLVPVIQVSLAGTKRVYELLDEPVEPVRYKVAGSEFVEDMIRFDDVVYSYDGRNRVLDNLTITVRQGEKAAFAGPSGGGKSTILKLLMGFYPPDEGRITVAGKGLGKYSLEELRKLIAYVSQDAVLFDGTIRENIRYGFPDASEEQIMDAAKAANAHNFIMELPEGYDTRVGEGGSRFSGGQRQLISIARAIVRNPQILLLDEATSALDSENEYQVRQALDVLMENCTVVMIAHRLSTIENADVIYVIDGGRVVEKGKHHDLIAKDGLYNSLYSTQFKVDTPKAI